ncbi:Fic family protein [Nocardia sp. NPDC050799]|uniref:Fic family protein n=1 Tax=Nocardia sp. NPDC050799 TaxID=3154842 RepID=UPI0033D8523F
MTRPDRYPFIAFSYDTKGISADLWIAFGEAMSKCQHLAGAPLKPQAAEEMASVYLARGVQATTAIEGNTLSDSEVQEIVNKGSAGVSESRAYLEREVQNVIGAIRDIDHALQSGKRLPITVERLCELNAQILEGIPEQPEVEPGKLRKHNVHAGKYLAPAYSEVPYLLDRFVKWLEEMRFPPRDDDRPESRFVNAVLSAILAHLYIAWIHPFGNGNGRLARLIEVQILSESGIVPIVATNLLSDFYNKTRNRYYLALDEAQRDVTAFIRYALQGFLDELRDQIKRVRQENLRIHWESHVYEVFRTMPSTPARDRQRELALELPGDRWVSRQEATELSIRLAKKYAQCGDRTPARDLNDLCKMGLARRSGPGRYRANRKVIEAFIPPTWCDSGSNK